MLVYVSETDHFSAFKRTSLSNFFTKNHETSKDVIIIFLVSTKGNFSEWNQIRFARNALKKKELNLPFVLVGSQKN